MPKDRLGELFKVQNKDQKYATVDVESENAERHDNRLKKTFQRAEVIGQWIEGVERNLEALKQYISRINDIRFNQKDLNEKIDSLFQNNTSICHRINGKLKEMEEELKTSQDDSAESRIKNIQYNTLRTRYIDIFKLNSNELENFRNTQKSFWEAQLRAKGVRVTDEELVALLEEKANIQVFTDNIIAETAEAKRVLADIEERHQQLLKIERMLQDVRDLFLEMSILIDAQQDLIDRVEYQAEQAKEFVSKTPRILSNALTSKKKYLKWKIYLSIALVIFIVILLIMLLR